MLIRFYFAAKSNKKKLGGIGSTKVLEEKRPQKRKWTHNCYKAAFASHFSATLHMVFLFDRQFFLWIFGGVPCQTPPRIVTNDPMPGSVFVTNTRSEIIEVTYVVGLR